MTDEHEKILSKAVSFVRDAFRENPHYSFNDWTIMAEHSENVMNKALLLAEEEPVDKIVVGLAALFHDIGKTVKADEKTLLEKHEEMGLQVTENFINPLPLNEKQKNEIKDLFRLDNTSLEKQIVKDADYMDFFINERLHQAFKSWVDETKLPGQLERKLERFEKMMPKAKEITRPYYEKVKSTWGM